MADEGRTHFVGDGCEGGHWSDIPAGAQLIEAKLDAGIPPVAKDAHFYCQGQDEPIRFTPTTELMYECSIHTGSTEEAKYLLSRLSALERVAECARKAMGPEHRVEDTEADMALREALKALDEGEKREG